MKNHSEEEVQLIYHSQKQYFLNGNTRSISFRRKQLTLLLSILEKHESELQEALWKDLRKSAEEAYLTEIGLVKKEITLLLKNLTRWSARKRVRTPLHLFPSRSFIMPEPRGNTLIISPWNYPVQLLLMPLAAAIAAGNCAVLKPSEFTPHTSSLLEKLITHYFQKEYIAVIHGHEFVLNYRFDFIFFTGSTRVGKLIMQSASRFLTPVLLELGGKSPCIVDETADINVAARRIAWGKTINAGQTCIAPDHVYIHSSVKDKFCERFAFYINEMYGSNPAHSKHFARIIHQQAFKRIEGYLQEGEIIFGGRTLQEDLFIEPTLIQGMKDGAMVMQEEIFGPVLPIITFTNSQTLVDKLKALEKPLSFYYFGSSKNMKLWLENISAGGVCINDTLMHFGNHNLPFGGVGNSGMGKYHGKESFMAFSHLKSIVKTPTWLDLPFKYAPYTYFRWLKRII